MGHDVAIAANFGVHGATTFWDGMPVFSAQSTTRRSPPSPATGRPTG